MELETRKVDFLTSSKLLHPVGSVQWECAKIIQSPFCFEVMTLTRLILLYYENFQRSGKVQVLLEDSKFLQNLLVEVLSKQ